MTSPQAKLNAKRPLIDMIRSATVALVFMLAAGHPAHAHHVMDGKLPVTFAQGMLSGLGHPVIGIDHLAFIVAMGVAVGAAGLHLALPAVFIAVSAIGVALHLGGMALPASELVVAASVLLAGAMIASGRAVPVAGWAALFALAGLFHGYAFGESIFGAEPSPLVAYLIGLAIVQAAVATGCALIARRSSQRALAPRLAGAAIACVGIAILAGQIIRV
jgi:urease accessory protein